MTPPAAPEPMNTPPLRVDPCRCPLCGQANACAMATPEGAVKANASAPGPCWCTRVQFAADLLKQVPQAARHKACICAACAKASETPSTGDKA